MGGPESPCLDNNAIELSASLLIQVLNFCQFRAIASTSSHCDNFSATLDPGKARSSSVCRPMDRASNLWFSRIVLGGDFCGLRSDRFSLFHNSLFSPPPRTERRCSAVTNGPLIRSSIAIAHGERERERGALYAVRTAPVNHTTGRPSVPLATSNRITPEMKG